MIPKALRKLFATRDDSGYDSDRARDAYMDVLRDIQSGHPAEQPSQDARSAAEDARSRLQGARPRRWQRS